MLGYAALTQPTKCLFNIGKTVGWVSFSVLSRQNAIKA
jgi:hypothetical protein